MSGSDGFQVDLNELSTLANTDIPYIANTCSNAETTLKTVAWQNDSAMFDDTSSTLYLDNGTETAFVETRGDLENLLDALSSSMWQCSRALNEILRRYQAADGQAVLQINRIGSGL